MYKTTQSNPEFPEIMTQQQAADYLQVTRKTLIGLVKKGDIPCVRAGGRRLFRKQRVNEALDRMAGIDSKAA